MKNNLASGILILAVVSSFVVSPQISNANSALPSDSSGRPTVLPPAPTLSPVASSQDPNVVHNNGVPDFLDHSLSKGYGRIIGHVIDMNTGDLITNAVITIPELHMTTRVDSQGKFSFGPIQIGASSNGELDVTLIAHAPGYGPHTMTTVGVFSQDTADATLAMTKGTASTSWFGLLPKSE